MAQYPDWSAAERDGAATAIAAILDSLGYNAMAADCRGECRDADLPRYARVSVRLAQKHAPAHVRSLKSKLMQFGLLATRES